MTRDFENLPSIKIDIMNSESSDLIVIKLQRYEFRVLNFKFFQQSESFKVRKIFFRFIKLNNNE